jgi:hypothetical protein
MNKSSPRLGFSPSTLTVTSGSDPSPRSICSVFPKARSTRSTDVDTSVWTAVPTAHVELTASARTFISHTPQLPECWAHTCSVSDSPPKTTCPPPLAGKKRRTTFRVPSGAYAQEHRPELAVKIRSSKSSNPEPRAPTKLQQNAKHATGKATSQVHERERRNAPILLFL